MLYTGLVCFMIYMVGGMVWFLIFAFLKDQSMKKAFFKSLVWPYFMIKGVRYWTKKESHLASGADYICGINDLKCDPNYNTKK